MKLTLLVLILGLCSTVVTAQTEFWASKSNSRDQGKLVRRHKAWTKDAMCHTYADNNIQQRAYIRRLEFYRPNTEDRPKYKRVKPWKR